MTTKIVSASQIIDIFVGLGTKLLDCQKYLDVKTFFATFVEALVACACSCFPAIDTYTDDEDDDVTQTEQDKVMKNILYANKKVPIFHYQGRVKLFIQMANTKYLQ